MLSDNSTKEEIRLEKYNFKLLQFSKALFQSPIEFIS